MHLHLYQHVNCAAQLFHGHADPWELLVEDMDLYRGCEDFCDAHGLQEDDVLIFRHVGYFKFHFFVIRNKEQLDLPEAHGDGIERQPAEDGEAIFVPTMSSINLDVGLTTLSGCRTLAIYFIEFCNDESILTNFIFWTESEGDTVDVRHGIFTLTFINVGELINYGEQHAFLRPILCRHRNVSRDVFHNVLEMLFGSIFVVVAAAVAPVVLGHELVLCSQAVEWLLPPISTPLVNAWGSQFCSSARYGTGTMASAFTSSNPPSSSSASCRCWFASACSAWLIARIRLPPRPGSPCTFPFRRRTFGR
nr:hypothetical protein Itr_chr07CG11820 [Ipomoea trifida]